MAWEIGVPLLLVIGLPFLFSTPWPVMLLYQPDIISWLMAMMLLSIGTATTKTLLVILAWRKRQDQRRPVMQARRLDEGVATRRNDESKKEATAGVNYGFCFSIFALIAVAMFPWAMGEVVAVLKAPCHNTTMRMLPCVLL